MLAATDATVVPSIYEPFGMVALEAAAAGAPLAVAATGGLAEIVEPGVTGVTFPPRTPTRSPTRSAHCSPTRRSRAGGPGGQDDGRRAVRWARSNAPWRRTATAIRQAPAFDAREAASMLAGSERTRIVVPEGNLLSMS